jgi:hypothetical protein
VVLVEKKDKTLRFCVDFRRLNSVTIKTNSGLQRIDAQLDSLEGSKWFSALDITSAYWNVEMEETAKEKTAFSTRLGHFQFKRMPFGLVNAGATFSRLMQHILKGLEWKACLIYLDDVITLGKDFDDALNNQSEVLTKLETAGIKLKPKKCFLFQKEVEFLGHLVTENGVRTSPGKIEAVKNWPAPENLTEVKSFLGLVTYYKEFIPSFGDVARPLYQLSKADQEFIWDEFNRQIKRTTDISTDPRISEQAWQICFGYGCFGICNRRHSEPDTRRRREGDFICKQDLDTI